MSDKFKRRNQRRPGSFGARRKQQLVPIESIKPLPIGKAEIAALAAMSVVAVALIALIWIVTARSVADQRAQVRDRAEQFAQGQVAVMAETIGHEILMVDQSLSILQSAWQQQKEIFDLRTWRQNMPALTKVASDLFIADDKHIIQQDIMPQAVGQGVGAAYASSLNGALQRLQSDGTDNKEAALLAGRTGDGFDAREFLMYVVRPLAQPKGWLIGASYRSAEVTRLFAHAALGINPVLALIDTRRGQVQAVVGPAARHPKLDVSRSPLYSLIGRSASGVWTGETPIDGVQRILAFQTIPGRDMAVVLGVSLAEAMTLARETASISYTVAAVATGLVVIIAGLVFGVIYNRRDHKRRLRELSRNRSELERLRGNEAVNLAKVQLGAAQIRALFDNVSEGVAVLDAGLRLVQWNALFLHGIGVDLRPDMPLDALLREQHARGLFHAAASDPEAEIARRVAALRLGEAPGIPQTGPEQEALSLRSVPLAEGGALLILSGLTAQPQVATAAVQPAVDTVPIAAAPKPLVW